MSNPSARATSARSCPSRRREDPSPPRPRAGAAARPLLRVLRLERSANVQELPARGRRGRRTAHPLPGRHGLPRALGRSPPPRSRTGIGDKGRRNRTPDPNAWLAARLLGLSVFERHVAPSSMCRLLTASTFLVNRSTRCEYSRLDSSRARPRRRTRRRLTCPLCCREHVYPLIVERAIIVAFLSPAPIWGHVGARSFGCSCARTNSRPPSRSVTQSSIVSRTSSCRRRNYDDRTHQGRGRCTPEST